MRDKLNGLSKLSRVRLVELIYDLRKENAALEERCEMLEHRRGMDWDDPEPEWTEAPSEARAMIPEPTEAPTAKAGLVDRLRFRRASRRDADEMTQDDSQYMPQPAPAEPEAEDRMDRLERLMLDMQRQMAEAARPAPAAPIAPVIPAEVNRAQTEQLYARPQVEARPEPQAEPEEDRLSRIERLLEAMQRREAAEGAAKAEPMTAIETVPEVPADLAEEAPAAPEEIPAEEATIALTEDIPAPEAPAATAQAGLEAQLARMEQMLEALRQSARQMGAPEDGR